MPSSIPNRIEIYRKVIVRNSHNFKKINLQNASSPESSAPDFRKGDSKEHWVRLYSQHRVMRLEHVIHFS